MDDLDSQLVSRMVAAIPELQPLLDEHLDDNFGELLPYIFLSDVERHVEAAEAAGDPDRADRVLALLENEAGRDTGVDNLIGAGFVEMLPDEGQENSSLIGRLGAKLSFMYQQGT